MMGVGCGCSASRWVSACARYTTEAGSTMLLFKVVLFKSNSKAMHAILIYNPFVNHRCTLNHITLLFPTYFPKIK